MADADHTPPLLTLPLELREIIYKEVLSNPLHSPHLLSVCKEIHSEARKFLYQRPLLFRGQAAMYHWLDQAPKEHLHHVIEITLELQDVDLKPLLDPVANFDSESSTPRLSAWELHESELDTLNQALGRLENVKTLTLRALPERQSFLYREFLANVLESLGSRYPNLSSLTLDGNFHHQSLAFLSSLHKLESFSFDGFSSSSPVKTATILSSLTHLTSLSIISKHAVLTPTTHQHSSFTSKRQSLTTPVLLAMKQLASLSLIETMHPTTGSPLFFTPEVLSSLRDHPTLDNLSIRLSDAPNAEILEAFEDFLENAPGIQRLELDWPGLEPETLETYTLLPENAKDFWVRCEGMEAAFDILCSVMESREAGDLQALERVVLIKGIWGEPEAASGAEEAGEGEVGQEEDGDEDSESVAGEDDDVDDGAGKVAETHVSLDVSSLVFAFPSLRFFLRSCSPSTYGIIYFPLICKAYANALDYRMSPTPMIQTK